MSYLDDFDSKPAAAGRDGEFFAQQNDTGTAVLVSAEVTKTRMDPHTYKLVFKVTESKTGANEVGSQRVVLKSLDKGEFDLNFAKRQVAELAGTDPENKEAFKKVLRLQADGYTSVAAPCPLSGMEYRYTVGPTTTKKGETQFHPTFKPVKFESAEAQKASVEKNRTELGIQ